MTNADATAIAVLLVCIGGSLGGAFAGAIQGNDLMVVFGVAVAIEALFCAALFVPRHEVYR